MKTKRTKTTTKADRVLKDALKLPAAERADIASCLYGSLNGEDDVKLHPDWDKEIERRLKEIDEGKAKLVPRKRAEKWIFGDA